MWQTMCFTIKNSFVFDQYLVKTDIFHFLYVYNIYKQTKIVNKNGSILNDIKTLFMIIINLYEIMKNTKL